MRALILVLSTLVVGLSVPVLLHAGGGARPQAWGALFEVRLLLADAQAGEQVTYRDQEGNQLTWIVEGRGSGSPDAAKQRVRIRRRIHDRTGRLVDPRWGDLPYEHDLTQHGWYPLMAPEEPEGLDRVWVWARIRQETRAEKGRPSVVWRVDFVDPGLAPGADDVQAWFDPAVPVFGIREWHRAGRVWTLVDSKRAGSGS
jgi:hypothetical protein